MKRARAEILSTRKIGAYQALTLVAPEIAERARPGQFLAVKMPSGRDFVLPRHFAIHQASRRGGWAGTLEFVVEPTGPGSSWLGALKAHEFLDVIGPLGKGFAFPKRLTNCLLVAEGRGETLRIVSDHCPFAGSVASPVICAVDRGMVKGMLATLYGDTSPETASSRALGDDTCITAVPVSL